MGLAVRVIPTLLCRGRTLVKGQRFHSWRSVGVVAQAVRIHQARGVDELVLLDISATPEDRRPDLALVEELTAGCFMPLAVGGGVRSVQDVRDLLNAGADKIVINSQNLVDPFVIGHVSLRYGAQAVVASIDYSGDSVYSHGGMKRYDTSPSRGLHPVEWARAMEAAGAGEILLTSIDREGMLEGYDLNMLADVCSCVTIPVIAHGGCGSYQDMDWAIKAGASAVAAGALFQFTDATPKGAAEYLASKGHEVRL